MKRVFYCILLLLLSLSLIKAQQKTATGLVKARAFYQLRLPGTQMVDEKGQPVSQVADTIHFIVMEIRGNQVPVVDSLFYFGKYYRCTVSGISNPKWNIGNLKRNGKTAAWQVQPNSGLWMVEFTAVKKTIAKKPAVVVKGKIGRKKIVTSLSIEEELETDITQ